MAKKFKYFPPNFTLTKEGIIAIPSRNYFQLMSSYVGHALHNLQDADLGEPSVNNTKRNASVKRELKCFIDDQDDLVEWRERLANSTAATKLYNTVIRAAIAKAKSGNLKGNFDTRPKFSVTPLLGIKISNLNAVVSSYVAMAVFNLRDSDIDVTPTSVSKELKEFLNANYEFTRDLYISEAVRTLHNKMIREVIAFEEL